MASARSRWQLGERGLRVLLTAVFLVAVGMKLAASEFEVAGVSRFGYAPWFMYAVGVAQVVGAVLLWVRGIVAHGALLLAVLMAGGVVSHLRVGDPLPMPLPALVLLCLLCLLTYARRGELLGRGG